MTGRGPTPGQEGMRPPDLPTFSYCDIVQSLPFQSQV